MKNNALSTPPGDPCEIVEIPRAVWNLIKLQAEGLARSESIMRELAGLTSDTDSKTEEFRDAVGRGAVSPSTSYDATRYLP